MKKKQKPFWRRLLFAIAGISIGCRQEKNFRIQLVFGIGAILILILTGADAIWCAIFSLIIGGVLSAELINSSLERVMDRLHPENHPEIGAAKDCAAGAVLILSLTSLVILAAYLWNFWSFNF